MSHIRLSYREVLASGEAAHLTRAALTSARPTATHDHDFYELIQVTSGAVLHHITGHGADMLNAGDLVFVRPPDTHALQGRSEDATVTVVAFHPDVVTGLGTRHGALADSLFWAQSALPIRIPAARARQADIADLIARLDASCRDTLAAEAFLLPLCVSLAEDTALPPDAPEWLISACIAARDPVVFREGAAGFARVAGRAHPHVSRTVRRFLNQSPSDYVNRQRMAHAARRLSGTADSIARIAADCGIPNLSHFHKLFRQHHGTTPVQYRKSRQRDLVQP